MDADKGLLTILKTMMMKTMDDDKGLLIIQIAVDLTCTNIIVLHISSSSALHIFEAVCTSGAQRWRVTQYIYVHQRLSIKEALMSFSSQGVLISHAK
eukprot:7400074-Karenia_brevis.AAC.1